VIKINYTDMRELISGDIVKEAEEYDYKNYKWASVTTHREEEKK
jgi:hypothetical protein